MTKMPDELAAKMRSLYQQIPEHHPAWSESHGFMSGAEAMWAEVERLSLERDAYAKAMAVALHEGIFANKRHVKQQLESILGPTLAIDKIIRGEATGV